MKIRSIFTAVIIMLLLFVSACGANKENTGTNSLKYEYPAVVTTAVHLRESESIVSKSLAFLEKETSVGVLSSGDVWTKVQYNELTGFVPTEHVKADKLPGKADDVTASVTDSGETKGSEETEANGETEQTAAEQPTGTVETTPVETSAAYADPLNGSMVNSGAMDVNGLPNKSIPYGNDWEDKDSSGLANGIHYYESMYGKYAPVYRIKTDEKLLYLTFDEGYEAGYTPIILDVLKEKNVKAVFFLTKQFFDSDPELIQRMIDEGHVLGNHSCTHPAGGFPKYVDEHGLDAFANDISKLHKLIYDQFGYQIKLFRFPEGEASELTMAYLYNVGYTPVFWSYAHRDFVLEDQPPVDVTLQRCISHMAPGSVYLLHAVSSSNTYALADFIDQAREAGYEFGVFPVDEVTH